MVVWYSLEQKHQAFNVCRSMHDVAKEKVKDQQEDQRDSDDEEHDADNQINHAAVIGQPIVP